MSPTRVLTRKSETGEPTVNGGQFSHTSREPSAMSLSDGPLGDGTPDAETVSLSPFGCLDVDGEPDHDEIGYALAFMHDSALNGEVEEVLTGRGVHGDAGSVNVDTVFIDEEHPSGGDITWQSDSMTMEEFIAGAGRTDPSGIHTLSFDLDAMDREGFVPDRARLAEVINLMRD